MGEYGDLLLSGTNEEDEPVHVSEEQVLEVLEKILVNNNSSIVTKEYCINAIVKLSTRFSSSSMP